MAILEQNIRKEQQRLDHRQLRAPVAGTVHQLNINTIGAVIRSAEPLLTLIPDNTPLEIEAMILNKDIGFVETDQIVEIKLDHFVSGKIALRCCSKASRSAASGGWSRQVRARSKRSAAAA